MKEQKRFLELSEFEWRLLIKCLNEARSLFLDNGKTVEDIKQRKKAIMNSFCWSSARRCGAVRYWHSNGVT